MDSDSRSRSRSPRQNRKSNRRKSYDSYSRSDSYSDYSDSFVSESESERKRKNQSKKKPTKKSVYLQKGRSSKLTPRGTQGDQVTRRILSARRIKLNEYKNEIQDLHVKLQGMSVENKTLKRQYHLQNRALEKFEIQENELPNLLQKHLEETRVLKEQLRKQKEKQSRTEDRLKECEIDLSKQKHNAKKYRKLVEEKNLGERDDLSQKLSKAESSLDEKNRRVKDLERHIENLTKNHKHQLGVEGARQRETQRQFQELREENERLQTGLKEKLKELELRNIYANRLIRRPHKLPPTSGSSSQSTPLPMLNDGGYRKLSLTPNEKVSIFERRGQQQERSPKRITRKKDRSQERRVKESKENEQMRMVKRDGDVFNDERAENHIVYQKVKESQLVDSVADGKQEEERLIFEERERMKEDARRKEEEAARRDRMVMEQREREEREQRMNEQRERDERDQRLKEKREREEREMYLKSQREREEREKQDRLTREQEEVERKVREEKKVLENDPKEQERRRQKDLLLAKMREIDDKIEETKKREVPQAHGSPSASKRKEYNFTEAIENMHHGKPSRDDIRVPVLEKSKKSFLSESSSSDLYQPSFATKPNKSKDNSNNQFKKSSAGKTRQKKKAHLMEQLFGENAKSNFTGTSSQGNVSGTHRQDSTARENSSMTLFGGGAALVDEDSVTNKELVFRRQWKQPATLNSAPAVNAVDAIDDDIEEVVL